MYPTKPNNSKQKVIAGTTALVVVVVLLLVANGLNGTKTSNVLTPSNATTATTASTPPANTANTPATSSPASTTSTTVSSGYKDGTYSAISSYYVPHGSESIKVTLTVKGGVITDSQVLNSENNRESAQYQEDFSYEYQSSVVGKNVNDVQLSRVAGASDTTNGFNDALDQIKNQAQA